jgi:hypothetical protein
MHLDAVVAVAVEEGVQEGVLTVFTLQAVTGCSNRDAKRAVARAEVGSFPFAGDLGGCAPVDAAVELARSGVMFVVVGSCVRRIRQGAGEPGDLDVAIHPDEANLARVQEVLPTIGVRRRDVPSPWGLRELDVITLPSAACLVDLMLATGRTMWDELVQRGDVIEVEGVPLLVASTADAAVLRERFAEEGS